MKNIDGFFSNVNHLTIMRQLFLILSVLFFLGEATAQCPSWSSELDSIKMMRHRQVYQNHTESGNYKDAVYFWEYIYERTPGGFEQLYAEGVDLYKKLYELEPNEYNKKFYLKKIISIYDKRAECYPQNKGDILARKAFEMYSLQANDLQTFVAFGDVTQLLRNKTPSYILAPYAEVTERLVGKGKLSFSEADVIRQSLVGIANHHITLTNDEQYTTALAYVHKYLGKDGTDIVAFADATKKGTPSDCVYFLEKYQDEVANTPDDRRLIQKAYTTLKQMDCADGEQYFGRLLALADKPNADLTDGNTAKTSSNVAQANMALKMGKYNQAVDLYLKAANDPTTDTDKKADCFYQVAQIQYSKLKKNVVAKHYAMQAATLKPSWGKPYTLIGDMYTASMKTCYPTDPVMQKVVLIAAMEKWEYAISLDDDKTAKERIAKYRKYLPTRSEIFLHHSLKEGKSVKIGCWIEEKIRVRVQE